MLTRTLVIAAAVAATWPVADAATMHRHHHRGTAARSARPPLTGADPSPAGSPSRAVAAPGGEDGGAGGYGKVGNPYSQAGYGTGAFGNGRPSTR